MCNRWAVPAQRQCEIFSYENWEKSSLLLEYGYSFIIIATNLYWSCWLLPFLLLTKLSSFEHSAFDITFIKVQKLLLGGAFVFPGLKPFSAKFLAMQTTWIFLKCSWTFWSAVEHFDIVCHPRCVNTVHDNKTISLCKTLWYGNLKSYTFWLYKIPFIRLCVSEICKEGNRISVAINSTIKPMVQFFSPLNTSRGTSVFCLFWYQIMKWLPCHVIFLYFFLHSTFQIISVFTFSY
jgi:hypothetical protein